MPPFLPDVDLSQKECRWTGTFCFSAPSRKWWNSAFLNSPFDIEKIFSKGTCEKKIPIKNKKNNEITYYHNNVY